MHTVHSSENGEILQSDIENCFYFIFKSESYRLNVCGFMALKVKLDAVDVVSMILSDAASDEIELIPLCNLDRILLLDARDVLELRELFSGAVVMLELNSILHARIYSKSLLA